MADNVKHNIRENYANLKRQRGERSFIQIINTVREGKSMSSFSQKELMRFIVPGMNE